jgi:4-nitrophenyl phosphatase
LKPLSNKKLFLFDLDGVFYKGKESRVLIGGRRAIEHLKGMGKKTYVLTNNSTDTAETVRRRLLEFEIPFQKGEVITSGSATADYLLKNLGKVSYFLVGEKGLEAELDRRGHRRTRGDRADCVVVGLDRKVTYEKLDTAARLVRNGSDLVATHASRLYMFKTGPAMASGPLVKAIEYASGKRATVIGKPSPLMFSLALEKAGSSKGDAVMVGDQLDTDILGAARSGIDSVLVRSGVDKEPQGVRVVASIENVDELVALV